MYIYSLFCQLAPSAFMCVCILTRCVAVSAQHLTNMEDIPEAYVFVSCVLRIVCRTRVLLRGHNRECAPMVRHNNTSSSCWARSGATTTRLAMVLRVHNDDDDGRNMCIVAVVPPAKGKGIAGCAGRENVCEQCLCLVCLTLVGFVSGQIVGG